MRKSIPDKILQRYDDPFFSTFIFSSKIILKTQKNQEMKSCLNQVRFHWRFHWTQARFYWRFPWTQARFRWRLYWTQARFHWRFHWTSSQISLKISLNLSKISLKISLNPMLGWFSISLRDHFGSIWGTQLVFQAALLKVKYQEEWKRRELFFGPRFGGLIGDAMDDRWYVQFWGTAYGPTSRP